MTTKIHAAVDALALPIRFAITRGHRGDCPQARDLIEGQTCVAHVIADAACDADHLRQFIAKGFCRSRPRHGVAHLNDDAA